MSIVHFSSSTIRGNELQLFIWGLVMAAKCSKGPIEMCDVHCLLCFTGDAVNKFKNKSVLQLEMCMKLLICAEILLALYVAK